MNGGGVSTYVADISNAAEVVTTTSGGLGEADRYGRTRTHVGIDVFSILNSDAILTYNQTFIPGGAWLAPQSVLTPRFMKVSAQIDF